MAVEANLKSKELYKLLLIAIENIPMIISISYILNTVLAVYSLDTPLLSIISGMSILTWIFMYLSAIVFRFCTYHRMFLWYILLTDTLNTIDYYIELPISDHNMIAIHLSLIGIFLFVILYLYVRSNKKPTGKNSK